MSLIEQETQEHCEAVPCADVPLRASAASGVCSGSHHSAALCSGIMQLLALVAASATISYLFIYIIYFKTTLIHFIIIITPRPTVQAGLQQFRICYKFVRDSLCVVFVGVCVCHEVHHRHGAMRLEMSRNTRALPSAIRWLVFRAATTLFARPVGAVCVRPPGQLNKLAAL